MKSGFTFHLFVFNLFHKYRMEETLLGEHLHEKDLQVLITDKLNVSQQCESKKKEKASSASLDHLGRKLESKAAIFQCPLPWSRRSSSCCSSGKDSMLSMRADRFDCESGN